MQALLVPRAICVASCLGCCPVCFSCFGHSKALCVPLSWGTIGIWQVLVEIISSAHLFLLWGIPLCGVCIYHPKPVCPVSQFLNVGQWIPSLFFHLGPYKMPRDIFREIFCRAQRAGRQMYPKWYKYQPRYFGKKTVSVSKHPTLNLIVLLYNLKPFSTSQHPPAFDSSCV